uniref:RING-type domain-containing protein n=1 Tax=Sphaeramia orbicularis TaxID=375764 RepID=A0A673AG93_9TELE
MDLKCLITSDPLILSINLNNWCKIQFLCAVGFHNYDSNMVSEEIFQLPLNVYIIVVGISLFLVMPCLIFCCCFIRYKQAARGQYVYNEVVLKGAGKKMSLLGQTCAVCLEEFRSRDELGVFLLFRLIHKNKHNDFYYVCPMCNKPICRLQPDPPPDPEQP